MIVKVNFGIREDGKKLFCRYDAKVKKGKIVRDKNDVPVPSGFKIRKLGTQQTYDKAIDVEDAPYRYTRTNILVTPLAKEVQEPFETETNFTSVQI